MAKVDNEPDRTAAPPPTTPPPPAAAPPPPPPAAAAPPAAVPPPKRRRTAPRPKAPRPAAKTTARATRAQAHAEELLGAEATPAPRPAEPPREYGPSVDRSRAPAAEAPPGFGSEFRMMERWVRDRLQPVLFERRRPPLSFFWQWWRKLAMRERSDVVDEFGRDPIYSRKAEPTLDFLYRSYFRIEVSGLENVPYNGRGLVVANHSGTLPYDGIMLMHAVRSEHPRHREVRPLVEDFVFYLPYLGTMVNRLGGVRACPENAERLLRQDHLIAVFPEGVKGIAKVYRKRYQLQRFGRGGFVKLALRCDSPIIPAAIVGAEEIHPVITHVSWLAKNLGLPSLPITPTFPLLGPLGALPIPTKWFIRFGAPLYFNAEYGPEAADDRILVNRLTENVRSSIQELLEGLLRQRKSILFG
jgi:1-acyl-sn-glycerol-3-phosphate acyltransferase